MTTRIRRALSRSDEGFTLVELIASMFLFAVVLVLITSATISMLHTLRKQQGQADDLDGARQSFELLDRQVRYANLITQPGSTATGRYIEFQNGNQVSATSTVSVAPTASAYVAAGQVCYQWRLNTTSQQLQYRSWPATTGAATTSTGGWVTETTNATPSGSTAVFSTTANPYVAPTASVSASASASPSAGASVVPSDASLTVTFAVSKGNPATTTVQSQTLAAQNTGGVITTQKGCAPTSVDGGALRP